MLLWAYNAAGENTLYMKQEIREAGCSECRGCGSGHKYRRLPERKTNGLPPLASESSQLPLGECVVCFWHCRNCFDTSHSPLARSWAQPISVTPLSQLCDAELIDAWKKRREGFSRATRSRVKRTQIFKESDSLMYTFWGMSYIHLKCAFQELWHMSTCESIAPNQDMVCFCQPSKIPHAPALGPALIFFLSLWIS